MSTTRGLALLADRGFWLLDLKTGKQYPTELALQLAGYAGADGLVVWDEEAMPTTSSPACASTAGGPVPL